MLEVAVELGPWSGYNVLAQHLVLKGSGKFYLTTKTRNKGQHYKPQVNTERNKKYKM